MENKQNSDDEIKKISAQIKKTPNDPELYTKRGATFSKLGKYAEAIKDCDKVIELEPNNAFFYNNRGVVFSNLGEYEKAIKDYDKAIELKSDKAVFHTKRGDIFFNLGKYEKVIKDYEKAIELEPNNARFYNNRGVAFSNLGEYEKAIKDYEKAIELKPDKAIVYSNRGIEFTKLGKYEEAIENYNKAIELKYEDSKIYIYRGYAYIKRGENKKAFEDFIYTRKDAFEIAPIISEFKDYEGVIPYLLDFNENDFFNTTIYQDKYINNNKPLYKSVFARILKILILSLVHNKDEKLFAHYTTKEVIQDLLLKDKSFFRLNSIITTNDPAEGKTIYNLFNIDEEKHGCKISNDYQAFIGCFTFNYENLNQFRLYGKNQNQEATGISLNFNKKFFNETISDSSMLAMKDIENKGTIEENIIEEIDQDIKYPLFRCIYVDPELRKVISLGHKNNYLFYKENPTLLNSEIEEMIKTYIENINAKKKQISILLDEIEKNINDEGYKLNESVLYKLFLPLRYIIKHVAFEEEQECRIIFIKDLDMDRDDIEFTDDYKHMYINYRKITNDCLGEIIFAPKAEGGKVLKEAFKKNGITCKCRKSNFPFA